MDLHDPLLRRLRLNELRVLLEAVSAGSLAKAALSLSLSQPAVSKTIADLEVKLGVKLLDRTKSGVIPTLAGSKLICRAQNIFSEIHLGLHELADLEDPEGGHVRIGCGPIFAAGFVSAIVRRMLADRPRMKYTVFETGGTKLLQDRVIDLIISRPPIHENLVNAEFEPLIDERVHIVSGADHPLASRPEVHLDDLRDMKWILPLPQIESSVGNTIEPILKYLEIDTRNITFQSMSGLLIFSMLSTGNFLSVLPASVLRENLWSSLVRVLQIEIPFAGGPVGLITIPGLALSSSAQHFVRCARSLSFELGQSNES
jgi:DNA-binding transcriptional LysR family regulator